MSDNLLTVLHNWARRQDENFCTDAFAHLLRHLCKCEPNFACQVLAKLTGDCDWLTISADEMPGVTITTQVTAGRDRPDLVIRMRDRLVYVEVKMEWEPSGTQLERYRRRLADSGVTFARLVLLTRYPPELVDSREKPDFQCRWHQVADWLSKGLDSEQLRHDVSVYLVSQFVDFLKTRNITMDKVSSDLPKGLRSLRSLLTMVGEAIAARNLQYRQVSAWGYIGYFLENRRFFLGVEYDWPGILEFATEELEIRADAKEVAGFGEVERMDYAPWKCWYHELDLAAGEPAFFSLSRDEQMIRLQTFIDQCLSVRESIGAKGRQDKKKRDRPK